MSSTVRSEPLVNGERVKKAAPAMGRWAWLCVAILAFVFAIPGWFVGARLTLDGAVAVVVAMASIFGIAVAPQIPAGGALLGATVAAGLLFSVVEVRALPVRKVGGKLILLPFFAVLTYLLALAADYGSTAVGLLFADVATWPPALQPVFLWARQAPGRVGLLTLLLTHYPEILILGGVEALRRAARS